jgi:flagellar biosynthesis anti-sigma factor FlgM
MKIDNDRVTLSSVAGLNPPVVEKQQESGPVVAAATVKNLDRVELSLGKGAVDRFKVAAAGGADFRAETVAALKSRIAEGSYRVDARSVAEKLLGG